jgi:hypothetical protein
MSQLTTVNSHEPNGIECNEQITMQPKLRPRSYHGEMFTRSMRGNVIVAV